MNILLENFNHQKVGKNKIEVQQSLHSIKILGGTVSADTLIVATYLEEFSKLIADGGYIPEQMFNADETDTFRK